MKASRTLVMLGVIAGAGCLVYAAIRRLDTKNNRSFSGDGNGRDKRRKDAAAPGVPENRSLARSLQFARRFLSGSAGNIFLALRQPRNGLRSLTGKVVLITGGSRGFGLALAEEFASYGAKIILTARDAEELARARRKLIALGLRPEKVSAFSCDLTDQDQTRELIALAIKEFGQIDILVNNAGIITVGPAENQPIDAFKSAIESNYYTMVHATLAVLPQMLARREGSIVNITSIGGKVAVPHLLPYSASKFAALGFSQGLHAELRAKGICVTTVCPGPMRTGSHTHALFTGDYEREYRWFSLGASTPCVSTSARAAAKKVVRATLEGRTEITITPQAILAATLAQALPGYTAAVMHWINSAVLPEPSKNGTTSLVPGKNARGRELTALVFLGRRAAELYNEDEDY